MLTRKEQAELSRKKIIEAAENLIKEKGYEKIHIKEIASACNMSIGNFYHYFKSKEELFLEIDNIKFYESINALKDNVKSPASFVLSRIESYFLSWIDLMISYYGPSFSFYWVRRYSDKSVSSDLNNSRTNLMSSHILHILKKGIENKELNNDTPVDCIAFSIAYTIFGCVAHYGITEDGDFIRQWAINYCDIYIRNALKPYLIL